MQWFPVPQGGNKPGPMVKYVRHFDHLSQYAPDMVRTETRKNVSMGIGRGQKDVFQTSSLQIVENQRGGRRFGFQERRPNTQERSSGFSGKPQIGGKRKSGQGNQDQLG